MEPTNSIGAGQGAVCPQTNMTRLEQLRIDAGLSRGALYDRSGISSSTIRSIEKRASGQAATLKTLGDFFGVPASELVMPALPPGSYTLEPAA